MPTIPSEVVQIAANGGAYALFIWLLFRTQDRQDKREDKMMGLLEQHSSTLPNILKALELLPRIAEATADLVRAVASLERRLGELERNKK